MMHIAKSFAGILSSYLSMWMTKRITCSVSCLVHLSSARSKPFYTAHARLCDVLLYSAIVAVLVLVRCSVLVLILFQPESQGRRRRERDVTIKLLRQVSFVIDYNVCLWFCNYHWETLLQLFLALQVKRESQINDTIRYRTACLTCSKDWRVASLVHYTESNKKFKRKKTIKKLNR